MRATALVAMLVLAGCYSTVETEQEPPLTEHPKDEQEPICPVGERPLFWVGTPRECETIRFDCPQGTVLVQDACGCGCDEGDLQ